MKTTERCQNPFLRSKMRKRGLGLVIPRDQSRPVAAPEWGPGGDWPSKKFSVLTKKKIGDAAILPNFPCLN